MRKYIQISLRVYIQSLRIVKTIHSIHQLATSTGVAEPSGSLTTLREVICMCVRLYVSVYLPAFMSACIYSRKYVRRSTQCTANLIFLVPSVQSIKRYYAEGGSISRPTCLSSNRSRLTIRSSCPTRCG